MDIGTWNMEMILPGESRDCLHKWFIVICMIVLNDSINYVGNKTWHFLFDISWVEFLITWNIIAGVNLILYFPVKCKGWKKNIKRQLRRKVCTYWLLGTLLHINIKMKFQILTIVLFVCLMEITYANIFGRKQRVMVNGKLVCGLKPAPNVLIKLVDQDDGRVL